MSRTVAVRLDAELRAQAVRAARELRVSVSDVLRLALLDWLRMTAGGRARPPAPEGEALCTPTR